MDALLLLKEHIIKELERESYIYKKTYITPDEAKQLFNEYIQLEIPQRHIRMFNKVILNPRLIGIYSNAKNVHAPYGFEHHIDGPLSPSMNMILEKVNADLNQTYNAIVINVYRNGNDYIGWHKDREMKNDVVCTLSLGSPRMFQLRHDDTKAISSFEVESGDLFVMFPQCQKHTKHRVKKAPSNVDQRISLTFRIL